MSAIAMIIAHYDHRCHSHDQGHIQFNQDNLMTKINMMFKMANMDTMAIMELMTKIIICHFGMSGNQHVHGDSGNNKNNSHIDYKSPHFSSCVVSV